MSKPQESDTSRSDGEELERSAKARNIVAPTPSAVEIDRRRIPVVCGGAHSGGSLSINALDLARIRQL
ncbi:hypothetical protein ACWGDS_09740 [Streptomyces sp. NPDC055059]|jgi:hypothetical protein|uniref:Uncharacterized protein n=1 Tax=Streptomyces sp. NBC_00119 TaxID=2975659 RepID=A0AAU1U0E0_9ACTN|nr:MULTISPECIES: hypothetical protein [unclassified Streptomyces]MCX4648360.1 hypothetical protein [Streptomyces sp. NBC_01446]MCX5323522.1 hypothetical protein [Streptomyces sp. NBC_00120]